MTGLLVADKNNGGVTTPIPSTHVLPPKLQQELKLAGRPIRVEILECSGGEGHKKSAEAVEKALRSHFNEKGFNVEFQRLDVGSHMAPDPLGSVTLGKYNMIDLHNSLARNGHTKIIKVMTKIGKFVHKLIFPSNVKYFNTHYNQKAKEGKTPDLIVSAVPMINGPLLKTVKDRDIPVLVTTTDADNELFSINWPKDKNLGPYRYGIPYNSYEIAQKVNAAVDPKKIRGIGYPVRPEFLKTYTDEMRQGFFKELSIDPTKKVVGVMMGGLGGVVIEKYMAEVLQSVKKGTFEHSNSHFTFFCGRNNEMSARLINKAKKVGFVVNEDHKGEGIVLVNKETGVSISVVGFTKNVHKYMAISKCWVTKPGSSSFNECLCMGVPMLIDHTSETLPWEALNIELAETYGFGEQVQKFKQFTGQLNGILEETKNEQYHQAMQQYRNDRPVQKDFAGNIVQLSYELLQEAEKVRDNKETAKLLKEEEKKQKATMGKKKISCGASILNWLNGVGRAIAKTALKIYDVVVKTVLFPYKWVIENLTDYAYFSGFNAKKSVLINRRKDLILGRRRMKKGNVSSVYISPHKAKPIEGAQSPLASPVSKRPIDALYLKSGSEKRTGNAIIYVLGKQYQNFHPRNFDHLLDDGADVILFNPSRHDVKTMDADLKEVIKELKRRNPDQKLALHGYCVGAHIAPAVAADVANGNVEGVESESIPVIVDRGFGDSYELAKKISIAAKLPLAKKYINRRFNSRASDKIQNHTGRMLFLSPKDNNKDGETASYDQLMHKKNGNEIRNFTRELYNKHSNEHDVWINLKNADHWTPWTYNVHNQVKGFLNEQGIISEDFKELDKDNQAGTPEKTSVPWMRRKIIPLFI